MALLDGEIEGNCPPLTDRFICTIVLFIIVSVGFANCLDIYPEKSDILLDFLDNWLRYTGYFVGIAGVILLMKWLAVHMLLDIIYYGINRDKNMDEYEIYY